MITGEKVEEDYRLIFSRECPRPIKVKDMELDDTLFKDCLFVCWQPLLQGVLEELLINPPKINQLVKGKKGEKTFNKERTDELISTTETLVKKALRKTEEGVEFYKEGKKTAVKALTFCILGCQLLQIAKEKWKLSNIKAKLINKTLVHYYLEGVTDISNATMNDYEILILEREKRMETQSLPNMPEVKPVEEEINVEDNFSATSPLLLPRDKLKKLTLFDVDNYFLEGEEEMTDTIQRICTDEEVKNKRCITCDESHEFYSLASRKLIHLFIYKTDLFENINFNAECLLEEQLNVTELRRYLELFLRREGVNWGLTQKEKNKFVLCTVCHLIRHLKFLGQLDLADGIQTFFKFRGEIYNLSDVELEPEKVKAMTELDLDKPKIIGKEKPKEIIISRLPKQEEQLSNPIQIDKAKKELLKDQLDTLGNELNLDSLVPTKIIDYKRKAKELLNPEESEITIEPNDSWIDVLIANMQDREFLPFLAKEALIRLEKEEKKEKMAKDSSLISDELLEINQQKCNACMKNIEVNVCLEKTKIVEQAIQKSKKAVQKLWKDREDLRPCIANELLQKRNA
ncbi:MAG: hypothetical protein ACTSYH_13380 [Candidatus Heimdallarchaeaceae archaeon]